MHEVPKGDLQPGGRVQDKPTTSVMGARPRRSRLLGSSWELPGESGRLRINLAATEEKRPRCSLRRDNLCRVRKPRKQGDVRRVARISDRVPLRTAAYHCVVPSPSSRTFACHHVPPCTIMHRVSRIDCRFWWSRKINGNLTSMGSLKSIKMVEYTSSVSSAAVQLIPVLLSYPPNFRPGAVVICSSSRHCISSCSSKPLSPSSSSGPSPSTP